MNGTIVLMVEDNEYILEINSETLRMEGYTVLTATTIAEARAVLASSTPDIIILDIMLPDGSGIDFCKEIREKTTATIIFLTCLNEKEDIIEGLQKGGDDGGATTISSNGGTLQMIAHVLPENATNKAVTWSVANGTGVATISSAGLLTAISNGTVT